MIPPSAFASCSEFLRQCGAEISLSRCAPSKLHRIYDHNKWLLYATKNWKRHMPKPPKEDIIINVEILKTFFFCVRKQQRNKDDPLSPLLFCRKKEINRRCEKK